MLKVGYRPGHERFSPQPLFLQRKRKMWAVDVPFILFLSSSRCVPAQHVVLLSQINEPGLDTLWMRKRKRSRMSMALDGLTSDLLSRFLMTLGARRLFPSHVGRGT